MTTRCGGGTSGANPAYTAIVDITTQAIAAVLASRGLNWILPALPLLNIPPLTLASFCASDPPATPTFTTAEINAVLGLQFGADFDSGLSKLADATLAQMWDQVCICTSGALTAPPTIAQPANTNVPLPPNPGTVAPCITAAVHNYFPSGSNAGGLGPPVFHWPGTPVTAFRIFYANTVTSGAGYAVTLTFQQFDSTGTSLSNTSLGSVAAGASGQFDVPANPLFFTTQVTWTRGAGSGTNTLGISGEAYCNGQTPGAVTPCCPPDATTAATLDLILRTVTLIQRQAVPFAYVPGTAHTGLSGAGTLAVSGLLGAKVEVTTLPTSYGRTGTTPEELFDLGYITWGTADGYPQSIRVEHSPMLSLPPRAGAFTDLAYDLAPGVVVTITELVREP